VKYIIYYCIVLFSFILPCSAQSLSGIWENAERFIEYAEEAENPTEKSGTATGTFNMILKTYYRFVYEDMGSYPVTVTQQENLPNVYNCAIRYPHCKQPANTAVWVYKDSLFTSFYQRMPYTVGENSPSSAENIQSSSPPANQETAQSASTNDDKEHTNSDTVHLIDGFWVEQGLRNGILIYPQDSPEFFDAFFFHGNRYIKFRYWKGTFEYKEQHARFTVSSGQQISIPKMIKYADTVYRCITDNGSTLKNYEQGTFSLEADKTLYHLSVSPEGGGPGSHAAGDVYPHHQYPKINGEPFFYEATGTVFAFGTPFLRRSSVTNLQSEVKKHNSFKRKPPEPLLKADELDFYWKRIKEIRKEN